MIEAEFETYIPRLLEYKRMGFSPERAVRAVLKDDALTDTSVSDDTAAYKARECAVDPGDRAIVERVVQYAADALGIDPPRVRFYRSEGMKFRGATDAASLDQIWVGADQSWYDQAEIALHEVAHVGHLTDDPTDLNHETAERVAQRFVERGRSAGWIHSAARAVGA